MSKERLEDIKERFVKYEYDYNLNGEDIEWLIEQAERVEELEEEVEKQKNRKYIKMRQRDDFMKKAQRYREALEFYADQTIYKEELINEASYDADGVCISNDEYAPPVVYLDGGEKARKALEGKE